MSARRDWFQLLFGFTEAPGARSSRRSSTAEYDKTKQMLAVDNDEEKPGMLILRSLANDLAGSAPARIGDVTSKHALPENVLATFQVASQFNCLEFVGPSVVPEDGITGYATWRTHRAAFPAWQACSIACGPATAYRNFFTPVGEGQEGQRKDSQINNLEDFAAELDQICQEPSPVGSSLRPTPFFRVRSGYTEASHRDLQRLNRALKLVASDSERESFQQTRLSELDKDRLRMALRIGLHEEVQVTATAWGAKLLGSPEQNSFGVAHLINSPFFYGRPPSPPQLDKKDWIVHAMDRAFRLLKDVDLDVRIVTYAGSKASPGVADDPALMN
eukprot:Skav215947  [mRNA]  locus=scaffold226:762472:772476:+ [translate_table: standard]